MRARTRCENGHNRAGMVGTAPKGSDRVVGAIPTECQTSGSMVRREHKQRVGIRLSKFSKSGNRRSDSLQPGDHSRCVIVMRRLKVLWTGFQDDVPTSTLESIGFWQGRFGYIREGRSPGDGLAWEPPQHEMMFTRIAAQYTRASFVKNKNRPVVPHYPVAALKICREQI